MTVTAPEETAAASRKPGQDKLVSIGLFVYNAEELLAETLGYLTGQDYQNLEIVLCDDTSTDRTPEIAREWAERDPRIRYVRNERNLGIWVNPFHAFNLCTGEYFMWAAHDDIWDKTFISKMVKALETDPSAVAAFCPLGIVDYEKTLVQTKYDDMPSSLHALGAYRLFRLWFPTTAWIDGTLTSAVFRRAVLADAISFVQSRTPPLRGGWDRLIPLYCVQRGDFKFVPGRLFFRRMKKPGDPRGINPSAVAKQPERGRPLVRRLKDLVIRLVSPINTWRYLWPTWMVTRELIPFSQMTLGQRLMIEASLAVITAKKFLTIIAYSLFRLRISL